MDREWKEFKPVIHGLIWAGLLILILFLNIFKNLPKEDAGQVVDGLLKIYMFFAFLAIGERIYKWIKGPAHEKQDTPNT